MLLDIKNYKVSYNNKLYFEYPDLTLKENESAAILGESGCGKSTFINSLFSHFFKGSIKYDKASFLGQNIFNCRESTFKYISYMPQFAQNGFNPSMNLKSQVTLMLKNTINNNYDLIYKYLDELSLKKDILDKYPCEISGGMKQRLALLLGFIKNPKLFVMDEPSSAVDYITLKKLIEFIERRKQEGTAVLMVTHHEALSNTLVNKIIRI